MNTFVVCFLIIYGLLVALCTYAAYVNIKHTIYKYKYAWPVKHRIDNGIMQYSVDGKLWTDIVIYDFDLKYLKPKDNDEFESYKTKLNTMQECHKWNTEQLRLYCNKIREIIK